jgi:hypothetical protein
MVTSKGYFLLLLFALAAGFLAAAFFATVERSDSIRPAMDRTVSFDAVPFFRAEDALLANLAEGGFSGVVALFFLGIGVPLWFGKEF